MSDVSRSARLAHHAMSAGLTIALAESLTSGRVATEVGAGPDASEWFAGAIVAYQTRVKEDVLGLTPGTDPCSAACAVQLARRTRELLGADVALSTTGVGGPEPQDGHPPGTVYLGWATADATGHVLLVLEGSPESIIESTSARAIALLTDVVQNAVAERAQRDDVPSPATSSPSL